MSKVKLRWYPIFLMSILYWACNPPTEVGASFFEEESFEVHLVDSMQLLSYTLQADSLPTGQLNRLLVGYKNDPQLGQVSAEAHLQFGLDESLEALDHRFDLVDSITLVLHYDNYFFGDTNALQGLYLYQLTEELTPKADNFDFYNSDDYTHEREPLAHQTFYPHPFRGQALELRLPDQWGKELLELASEGAEEVTENAKFQDYFPGLILQPDTTLSTIFLGFSADAELRLYYRNTRTLPINQSYFTFSMADWNYYNQIKRVPGSAALDSLQNGEDKLLSNYTDQQSLIQGGMGLSTRIEFPSIRRLLEQSKDFLVNRAILRFYPFVETGDELAQLPAQLSAYWVDEDNKVVQEASGFAFLQKDEEFRRDTYYELDVTDFVELQLASEQFSDYGLMLALTPEDVNGSLHSVKIYNDEAVTPMRLAIYYLSIKE
ncbi:MAG: DUF4270 family protein [Saprospiraceae bacterium]|nr:DUF4270 family protein [Saprospiraceae bacterium]